MILNELELKNEMIHICTSNDNEVFIWFQNKTNSFCLELNGKVIKVSKRLETIQKKLNTLI